MERYDLVFINGIVATDIELGNYDIAIKDETIRKLVPRGTLGSYEAARVIDAEGAYITPGGVDAHVHLAEPALFGKGRSADSYASGSRSAIAGGTTTIITFAPQAKSQPSLLAALATTHALAKDECYADYSFHLICANAGPVAISEFPALREAGISSLKIYMTYELLQLRDSEILDVLLKAREQKITVMVHAENGDIIEWMTRELEKRKLFAPKYHVNSHPPVAEIEGTYRAISLSTFIDTPILLVHVSSPVAASRIAAAQAEGNPIYAETCPQYLFLTREDLDKPGFEGAKCVCSPPPREKSDHEGIWQRLEDGTFTVLSSDHCPFLYDDSSIGKMSCIDDEHPEGQFRLVPNGCPGLETRLALVMNERRLNMKRFVELTSTNAAKLYGLYPKKGALVEGVSDADLTIWYPEGKLQEFVLTNAMLHHACDYSPYEGRKFTQWPRYTILRGKIVWDRDGGGVVGHKGFGKFLERGDSLLAGSRSLEKWNPEHF